MIGTTIIFKVLFHFMCMGVLAASMSVHHMNAWDHRSQKGHQLSWN